jgi:preprotein translocase subunit SecB
MSDIQNAGRNQEGTLNVLAQYVKDFSFECPGAPHSLRGRNSPPGINISVNVSTQAIDDKDHEVELRVNAQAVDGDNTLFAIELIYGGVFRIAGFAPEALRPVTMIECPRLLFPFARQIIAEATRNGGFPPLMIDPIDFAGMYRQRLAEMGGPGGGGQQRPILS